MLFNSVKAVYSVGSLVSTGLSATTLVINPVAILVAATVVGSAAYAAKQIKD